MYIAAIVLLLFGGCGLQIFWLCDVFYSNIKAKLSWLYTEKMKLACFHM